MIAQTLKSALSNVHNGDKFEVLNTKLEALDLEPIKFKLIFENEWTLGKADNVEVLYKRFLFLNYKYPDTSIVPSTDIDAFWHYHLLDTQKYAEDCQYLFGYFLHHFPYFGSQGKDDYDSFVSAYKFTKELFIENFDETIHGDGINNEASMCNQGGCDGSKCDTDGPPRQRPNRKLILEKLSVHNLC